MNRYYIGLANTCHDPAIAIVDSTGKVVFAEALERYLQNKRAWDVQPDNFNQIVQLIETYCDPKAEFVVSTTWSFDTWQVYLHQLYFYFYLGIKGTKSIMQPSWKKLLPYRQNFDWLAVLQFTALLKTGRNLAFQMRSRFNNDRVIFKQYRHHLTHAATACYSSPFTDAACIIVDGEGEKGSVSCYSYRNGHLKLVQESTGTGSLGVLYAQITELCGFDWRKGEEWKVMGLAPYGKVDPEVYSLIRSMIEVKDYSLKFASADQMASIFADLKRRAIPSSSSYWEAVNLAASGQKVFSDVMEELLNNFYKLGISDNLVLGGGCALNSAFNGKLLEKVPFKALHVPSAPADDGNAIGAALLAYYEEHPSELHQPSLQSPYLGSTINEKSLHNLLQFGKIERVRHLPGTVHLEAAKLLSQGKLLAWVQGRAEFGPRALGNRSILADPRSPKMKEEINKRVKFREEYRPFAPSILHEFGHKYFENYQESPYMERTLSWLPEVREQVPAVVHVNNTGRLQTVKREWNEKYYKLIEAFYEITSVPIILNTSLNVMGKPIIHTVEDAISVFYTTGLDALVIEDYLIEK
ncbi:carbamoyltransferase [Nostoc commune NIES-4072]|uniref:Carbamoyltransferase n=1 Tax=Nostoc commune NIES-4072 TaxID=2005467 RepID=A0A2R5FRX5_NOSCO|nr:carbamoyltransferase C-terminal domain-containing protein [Nostoc commune]BBD63726.1 carbamoyltransferase [Nostoc commune HK-02]GBG18953.1 carbamoyltransferase [Nostoc commune NIES-4072]